MITFIVSFFVLVIGYIIYGLFVEKVVGADSKRAMPCDTMRDDIDYMPMPTWRVFLIQFLNIAGDYPALMTKMKGHPAIIVDAICKSWMGQIGGVLAILGVVVAPITTGDTALRSARLIIADRLHFHQDKMWRRVAIAVPLATVVAFFISIDFSMLWRYFGWLNQTLAMFTLWAVTVWITRESNRTSIITLFPAMFMTLTCVSFILVCPQSEGGLGLPQWLGLTIGATVTILCTYIFHAKILKH